MMFFQQFRRMFQSRTLRRPRPGMGPRNSVIELDKALVIAVRRIPLIPAAARRAGAGRGEKAVHRRLGSVAKVLSGGLRGDARQCIDRGIHEPVGERIVGIELSLQGEFGASFQQRYQLRPQRREKDRDRKTQHPHSDELERIGFQEILSHHALLIKCDARGA